MGKVATIYKKKLEYNMYAFFFASYFSSLKHVLMF